MTSRALDVEEDRLRPPLPRCDASPDTRARLATHAGLDRAGGLLPLRTLRRDPRGVPHRLGLLADRRRGVPRHVPDPAPRFYGFPRRYPSCSSAARDASRSPEHSAPQPSSPPSSRLCWARQIELRRLGFERAAQRARPLIEAIERYVADHGEPPERPPGPRSPLPSGAAGQAAPAPDRHGQHRAGPLRRERVGAMGTRADGNHQLRQVPLLPESGVPVVRLLPQRRAGADRPLGLRPRMRERAA